MHRKSTAWFLVFTTLAGPFICCCTTAKAMSWVSACLGCGPVACDQCCREAADAHGHSHAAKHGHHNHSHEHTNAGHLAGTESLNNQHSNPPRPCPCQRDRDQLAGMPATDGLDAKAITAPLDFVWMTVALCAISADPAAVKSGEGVSFYCSDGACLSGREILRAHSVLRI